MCTQVRQTRRAHAPTRSPIPVARWIFMEVVLVHSACVPAHPASPPPPPPSPSSFTVPPPFTRIHHSAQSTCQTISRTTIASRIIVQDTVCNLIQTCPYLRIRKPQGTAMRPGSLHLLVIFLDWTGVPVYTSSPPRPHRSSRIVWQLEVCRSHTVSDRRANYPYPSTLQVLRY